MGRKVVYNSRYGAYTLSGLALNEYIKEKYPGTFIYDCRLDNSLKLLTTVIDNRFNTLYVLSEFLGEIIDFDSLDKSKIVFEYFSESDIERHDPILVSIVERLGDKAGRPYSGLKIKDIGDSLYHIDEYDGLETVITSEPSDYWK